MKLDEIIDNVDSGNTVNWMNSGYEVQKWADGYNIVFISNNHAVGLTDRNGNMREHEDGFFLKGSR